MSDGKVESCLVVPDGSPPYSELLAERDRLLRENARLIEELSQIRVIGSLTDQLWQTIEDIAVGVKLECPKCRKMKPCDCDHGP